MVLGSAQCNPRHLSSIQKVVLLKPFRISAKIFVQPWLGFHGMLDSACRGPSGCRRFDSIMTIERGLIVIGNYLCSVFVGAAFGESMIEYISVSS